MAQASAEWLSWLPPSCPNHDDSKTPPITAKSIAHQLTSEATPKKEEHHAIRNGPKHFRLRAYSYRPTAARKKMAIPSSRGIASEPTNYRTRQRSVSKGTATSAITRTSRTQKSTPFKRASQVSTGFNIYRHQLYTEALITKTPSKLCQGGRQQAESTARKACRRGRSCTIKGAGARESGLHLTRVLQEMNKLTLSGKRDAKTKSANGREQPSCDSGPNQEPKF